MRAKSNSCPVALIVVCLLLPSFARAQEVADLGLPSGGDYPHEDRQVWMLYRKGLAASAAAAALAREPDTDKTAALLFEAEQFDDGLQVVGAVARRRVEQLPRALEALAAVAYRMRSSDARSYAESTRAVVQIARTRLQQLPREVAAQAAHSLLQIEGQFPDTPPLDWKVAQADFVREYAGTQAARLVEVDIAATKMLETRKYGEAFDTGPLDAIVKLHPGSTAAAKALYQKGFHIGVNGGEPRGGDPTDRLMRVRAIVEELKSGRYPRSEWVDRAPSLIWQFYAHEPVYAPGNLDRVLEISLESVRAHFTLADVEAMDSRIANFVTSRIPKLLESRGPAGVERALDTLEGQASTAPGIRYLRAMFYRARMRERPNAADRGAMYERAQESLGTVYERANGVLQRKALAALAALQFAERDYAKARENFRRYAEAYRESAWGWVAALRAGQCELALGNWKGAVAAFTTAATRYAAVPPAVVLAHTYRGWAHEGEVDFDSAVVAYRQAIASWDPLYGPTYSTYAMRVPAPHEPFGMIDESRVNRHELEERAEQLGLRVRRPGGGMLERGLWLLKRGKRDEGVAVLRDVMTRFGGSTVAVDARAAAQRARLDAALERLDVESKTRDEAAALKELELLTGEPFSFAVCAAKITRAAVLLRRGGSAEAEALMKAALEQWRAHQKALLSSPRTGTIAHDAVAIRDAVFRPAANGKPFSIVRSRLNVRLADGQDILVPARTPLSDVDNALYFDRDELGFFDNLMARLGSTRRSAGASIMAVPQPVGGAVDLLAFLNRFFAAQPGHWGGWHFETYPIVWSIEFTNAERTKAVARVRIGYQGHTAVMEKAQDRWIQRERTNNWIE